MSASGFAAGTWGTSGDPATFFYSGFSMQTVFVAKHMILNLPVPSDSWGRIFKIVQRKYMLYNHVSISSVKGSFISLEEALSL